MQDFHLIVSSNADDASKVMADHILESFSFEKNTDGVLHYKDYILVRIEEKHLFMNDLPSVVLPLRPNIKDIIFLSKHSSSADIKSITVHPTGNFSSADLGGLPGKLSESDPEKMSSALRAMKESYSGEYFSVTFEATHHGPLLTIPNYYIEIGTSEREWTRGDALDLIMEGVFTESNNFDNFVGIGGGHYMPKITEYFYRNSLNMGHMISKHSLEGITEELLKQSVMKTRNCKGFIMDNKGTKSVAKSMVEKVADELSLEIIKI